MTSIAHHLVGQGADQDEGLGKAVSGVNWIWPVSEDEAEYIGATGLTFCFPPAEPVEIRVVEENEGA